jgi:hypothetical protein
MATWKQAMLHAAAQKWFFLTFGEAVSNICVSLRVRISGGIADAQTQQIEVGAAVHRSLDELQAMDLPLDRAAAPRQVESSQESWFVFA